ncbi:MAG: YraN family protein, partial [Duncaniella sp.]|nr:YraN family protein [Duncaniella sp.]
EYLLTHGYAIGDENKRFGGVEIDFIARKDNRVCFVEVKTRSSDSVDPVDSVDRRKRQRLIHAADTYMHEQTQGLEPQFDLIFIIGNPDDYTLEHIEDAFYPTL